MAQTQAQYINVNLKRLANYINHLAALNKKYKEAIERVCSKSISDKIIKDESTLKYEKKMKESYKKAKSLYNDLRRIAENYKWGINVSNDIQLFNTRLNMARLPILKGGILRLEHSKQDGVPTGGASALQNIQDMYTRNINHEKEQAEKYADTIKQIPNAIGDFVQNYNDMKEANTIGADKYFHAKANTKASQREFLEELTASVISNLREITDTFKNTLFKGMTLKDSIKDSKEDLRANK